jgi:hypothetical protein
MTFSSIPLHALSSTGRDLHRPECVLALRDGTLCVSDWRGGVTLIRADGSQRAILAHGGPEGEGGAPGVRPNGVAIERDGSFLLANLGDAGGACTATAGSSPSAWKSRASRCPLRTSCWSTATAAPGSR